MKKQKIKILLLALTVVFTAQSCSLFGGSSGEQIELKWWKPFDSRDAVDPLIEAFQSQNPNITITYVEKDIETYEDELIDALASGTGPDIYSIHNDWLPKYEDKLVAAPDEIFGLRELQDQFVEVASTDLTADQKVYAVPLSVDVLSLYYNRDILSSVGIARPPATWQELVEMTSKLTIQDNFGDFQRSAVALGTADNVNRSPDILGLLMLQNGTSFYSPDGGSSAFNNTLRDSEGQSYNPAARALEFYTQFANPAKVTYTWNTRSNNSIEAFAAGKVAMIFSYSYLRDTLAEKAPLLNYGVAPAPQITTTERVNFPNYWAEGVAKQSTHAQAAWQFLKFISSKENLQKYYEQQKQPSSRIDIIEEQIPDPEIGVFAENALSAKDFFKPDSDDMEAIFVQMINDVVLRNVSPDQAVQSGSQKINLLLRNF